MLQSQPLGWAQRPGHRSHKDLSADLNRSMICSTCRVIQIVQDVTNCTNHGPSSRIFGSACKYQFNDCLRSIFRHSDVISVNFPLSDVSMCRSNITPNKVSYWSHARVSCRIIILAGCTANGSSASSFPRVPWEAIYGSNIAYYKLKLMDMLHWCSGPYEHALSWCRGTRIFMTCFQLRKSRQTS